jgi:hypothetical protein
MKIEYEVEGYILRQKLYQAERRKWPNNRARGPLIFESSL